MTFELTNALLSIGARHLSLRDPVLESLNALVQNYIQSIRALPSLRYQDLLGHKDGDTDEAIEIARLTVCLVGFLEAAAQHIDFWHAAERLELVRQLRNILSERFLVAVETASSSIRNSEAEGLSFKGWKGYMRRYAARGQPIGAMLLQQGFVRLVAASTSHLLAVPSTLERHTLLDHLMSGLGMSSTHDQEIDDSMIDYFTDIITAQMQVLEDGADYLQLGSAWQQRLAFSVKAFALEAFVHCMVIDEDIADADMLFSWLEDSLANQVQMTNHELGSVVLKSMAVVARYGPENASDLARTLLKYLISGTSQSSTIAIAAQSLSHVLRLLSQDAVITTLYSLGNVLSSNSTSEKPHHSSLTPNGRLSHHDLPPYNQQRTGSVISLSISGDEETSMVCGNSARAIVMIATSCNDSRITALAQSMLLQKIGKVNLVVDCRIIEEAAILAITGKETELKALLRFYSRLSQESSATQNNVLSEAVSI